MKEIPIILPSAACIPTAVTMFSSHTRDSVKRARCLSMLQNVQQDEAPGTRNKVGQKKSTNLHFRADTSNLEEREEDQTSPKIIRLLGVAVYVHLASSIRCKLDNTSSTLFRRPFLISPHCFLIPCLSLRSTSNSSSSSVVSSSRSDQEPRPSGPPAWRRTCRGGGRRGRGSLVS
jgi:hypothetical protein